MDTIGSALKTIGVRLKDDADNFRSTFDILKDISDKFKESSEDEKEKVSTQMCKEIIVIENNEDFDKHLDYKYIARSISTEELVIGYLNVDMPWYSDESCWNYIIRYQEYFGNYGCSTWTEELVYRDSIMPYTRHNYEIYAKEHDMEIEYQTQEEFEKELFQ